MPCSCPGTNFINETIEGLMCARRLFKHFIKIILNCLNNPVFNLDMRKLHYLAKVKLLISVGTRVQTWTAHVLSHNAWLTLRCCLGVQRIKRKQSSSDCLRLDLLSRLNTDVQDPSWNLASSWYALWFNSPHHGLWNLNSPSLWPMCRLPKLSQHLFVLL